MKGAPARLTWSLTPHSPAGMSADGPDVAMGPPTRTLSRTSSRRTGQGLLLNRSMLGDQGSPYVGRFARGWHRLPGLIPGQPQTRTGARPSIGTPHGRREPRGPGGRSVNERQAVRRWISRAPPSRSAAAQAEAVAPVVRTSSTKRTRAGTSLCGMHANASSMASSRCSRVRRACGAVAFVRRTKAAAGRSSSRASARASTRAWSKPRSARRRGASGTQVTASAGGGPSAATADASASPTPRHPENFRRCTASRAGPRYAKAARADAIGAGGQSRQRSTSIREGRPQRRHHGGSRGTSAPAHVAQNGHGPAPQPAQARGKRTSIARSSALPFTGARYGAAPTRIRATGPRSGRRRP